MREVVRGDKHNLRKSANRLQSTNQYNVRSEWHWFVRCDLQIFSGCACHLEQLHAQSPFFRIVSSIGKGVSGTPFWEMTHVFFPVFTCEFFTWNNFRPRMFVRCRVFFEITDVCSRMFERCEVFFWDRGCLLGVGYFLRSWMFDRCRVFFLRSRMFVRCRVFYFLRSRMFVRCGVFFEIVDVWQV